MDCFKLISFMFLLLLLNVVVDSCLRTGGNGGGEVPGACQACLANQVTLIPGDNGVTSVTPTATTPVVGADGCLAMMVTCDVSDMPNKYTNMGFNGGQFVPVTDMVPTITQPLVCSAGGVWTFTQAGVTTVINDVDCLVGDTTGCATCQPDFELVPGLVTPTIGAITQDANGCSNIMVTCAPSPTGGEVFMQFNDGLGGPTGARDEAAVATLICDGNGDWLYMVTPITRVECIA